MRLSPRRPQRHHPRVAVGVHLRGGDEPVRRQAGDPPARRRGRDRGAQGPAGHLRRRRPRVPRARSATSWSSRPAASRARASPSALTAETDSTAALARAREQHPDVLIEQRAPGDDLRLVVIDGRVVAAALRMPAEIVGTGRPHRRELIEAQSRRRSGRHRRRVAASRSTTSPRRRSPRPGWSFDDVLPEGERLRVRRTANLHQGGTIHDVTAELHPELCRGRGGGRRGDRHPGHRHRPAGARRRPAPTTCSSRPTSGPGWPTTSRSRPRRRSSTTCSRAARPCRRRGPDEASD